MQDFLLMDSGIRPSKERRTVKTELIDDYFDSNVGSSSMPSSSSEMVRPAYANFAGFAGLDCYFSPNDGSSLGYTGRNVRRTILLDAHGH